MVTREVQGLIEARLGDLEQKMRDLLRVQARLAQAVEKCRHSEGECPVLKDLHVHQVDQSGERVNGLKARRS